MLWNSGFIDSAAVSKHHGCVYITYRKRSYKVRDTSDSLQDHLKGLVYVDSVVREKIENLSVNLHYIRANHW